MNDITKCSNAACPINASCRRWTAPAKPVFQSWMHFPGGEDCEHFLPLPLHSTNQRTTIPPNETR